MWLHKNKEGFLHYRLWWNFETSRHRSIRLEFTPRKPFNYGINVDGGEGQVTFSFWLIFQVWLSVEGFLPESWYPTYQSRNFGRLPAEREISLRFHHWSLWWVLWTDPGSWSSSDPWWQQGNVDFWAMLFGRYDVEREREVSSVIVLPFYEGLYNVTVTKINKQIRYRRWYTRWLAGTWWKMTGRNFTSYEVAGGLQVDGEFKQAPIPVPGKGTTSYNCGEDGIYSGGYNAGSPEEAAFKMWRSVMRQRRRYGGALWIPENTDGAITNLGVLANIN